MPGKLPVVTNKVQMPPSRRYRPKNIRGIIPQQGPANVGLFKDGLVLGDLQQTRVRLRLLGSDPHLNVVKFTTHPDVGKHVCQLVLSG